MRASSAAMPGAGRTDRSVSGCPCVPSQPWAAPIRRSRRWFSWCDAWQILMAPWLATRRLPARVSSTSTPERPAGQCKGDLHARRCQRHPRAGRAERTSQVRLGVRRSGCHQGSARPRRPLGRAGGSQRRRLPHRDQIIARWAGARAAGARAVVTEVTAGAGTLLVGLEVTGTPAAREAGGAAGAGRS